MNCLFKQQAGIGDILFLQKAAQHFIDLGYSITWPILPQCLFIKDYIKNSKIEFVDSTLVLWNQRFDMTVGFETADRIFPYCSILQSKYNLIDISCNDWADYLIFDRNLEKEKKLLDILEISGKFTLTSELFGTPPTHRIKSVPTGKYKEVKLKMIDGFTPFDWCSVFERASEIIMVDTCFNYIIEKLELKAESLKLISRHDPPNFFHLEGFFKKNWEFIK